MAAVDSISFRHIAIMADLCLTRWALHRVQRRAPREGITVVRPLNHARGWSNLLAASRPRNDVHFAAAVSFFRALRCPIARSHGHYGSRRSRPRTNPRSRAAVTPGRVNEEVQRLKRRLLPKAPKTVNNVLTVLNVMMKTAVEWDVIDRVPCTIKLLRVSRGSTRFYDFDEFERLVAAARSIDSRSHLLVLLSGEAGLRLGEMVALEWADIDFVKRQLCVQRSAWKGQIGSPKGGRLRYVPLTARLVAALRDHRHLRGPSVLCRDDGAPLTQGWVQGYLFRTSRKASLYNNGPHMLRHTFCSHLAMRGAPARAIQELAVHRDLSTTQRYMHLSPAALDSAIRLLDCPGVLPRF